MVASLIAASRFNSLGEPGFKKVATIRMHSSLKGISLAREEPFWEASVAYEEDGAPEGL